MWKLNRNLSSLKKSILKNRVPKLKRFDWTSKMTSSSSSSSSSSTSSTSSTSSSSSTSSTSSTSSSSSSSSSSTFNSNMVVPKNEVIRFISDCLCKVGTTPEDGYIVGHHLMTSDYCGHFSHGMNRMQAYVLSIKNGITDPSAKPRVVSDFQAVALIDGNNGLGHTIGKYCMELAIDKAKKYGISMITVRGSNHYGICGYYTQMAIEKDLIGFTCSNTSPLMAPTRSRISGLGTNPLSLGMGASGGDKFLLDMATTAVAFGKIELAMRKNESILRGWALGTDGKITTNAQDAFNAGRLMPLGGVEENSSYKGYGLALMVEVLCGILSGSDFGPNIRQWKDRAKIANLGHCFIAINPDAFTTGSKDRLAKLLTQLRNLPPTENKSVLIPGDPERNAMKRVDREGGISYHPNQLKLSRDFAEKMGVKPMQLVPKK